jgi:hypothetical protein
MLGFVHQFVRSVAQQAVAGVVPRNFGDVQLLLLAVQVPDAVFNPVRPRRQRDSGGTRGNDIVTVRFRQLDAAPGLQPKARGQLSDHCQGIAAAELVLPAGGIAAGRAGGFAGAGSNTSGIVG